jgi:hypothetical protein
VAKAFLKDPSYKIRGITRDPTKPESEALIAQGIEVVKGDVDNVETLRSAFKGAHTIFGNTAFSNAMVQPTEADLAKLKPNQTLREWSYETEARPAGKKHCRRGSNGRGSQTLCLVFPFPFD